jgi:beta-aspartyl-peptidase (threonine type)
MTGWEIYQWASKMPKTQQTEKVILAIHGGTGLDPAELTPELEKQYRQGLTDALLAGYAKYKKSLSSLDIVEAAVKALEDDPLFNAGKGAVFNERAQHELDAAIMEGSELKAGAVAAVRTVKNPVALARLVMEKTPHVLLVGLGAERFAKKAGVKQVDQKYFFTDRRWNYLQELRGLDKASQKKSKKTKLVPSYPDRHMEWSTVGAVGLDQQGVVAAATSTGGLTNKMQGRVGDTPVIGAGTYADNHGCAVSATGHGEFFIRYGVAHEINALVRLLKWPLQKAADEVMQNRMKKAGGEGGVITLSPQGEVAFSFNSPGLYRGYITESGKTFTGLYD